MSDNSKRMFEESNKRTMRVFLRMLRRALAKAIEPKRPEPNLWWDIPIQGSLKGANALRERLAISEEGYLSVSGCAFADCRAYVIYTALDEVTKTSMYLIRLQELMQGKQISPHEDLVSRLVFSHVIEEQNTRERRLLEVLVTLVMLETTNEQQYYRHLLLLEDLDDMLTANADLEEFYGARSANLDFAIDLNIKRIRNLEKTIGSSKLWYRSPDLKSPLPERNYLRPGKILSSFRSKLKFALGVMLDNEKILFGFSYSGYAQKSESAHYRTNPHDFRLHKGEDLRNVSALGLLNFAILLRCHNLIGKPEVPIINKLSVSPERTNIQKIVDQITGGNISKGDFVLAYGDLAEVLEIRKSSYGYQSYKVRYLAEKPIEGIQEDWFPAYYVRLFYTRSRFKEQLKQMAAQRIISQEVAERMEKFSDAEVQSIIRASLIENWKRGLRNWVRAPQGRSKDEK